MDSIKIILVDWSKNALQSERNMGFNWFFNKQGLINLLQNMKAKKAYPIEIILVINDASLEHEYDYLTHSFEFIDQIIYRKSNTGLDWGAYNEAYQRLKLENFEGTIILMNSACLGPTHDDWLDVYLNLLNEDKNTGAVGASYNGFAGSKSSEFLPHLQSYFLLTSMKILQSVFPNELPYKETEMKRDIIYDGEIEFSTQILTSGYSIKSPMNQFNYKYGDHWDYHGNQYDPKLQRGWDPFFI